MGEARHGQEIPHVGDQRKFAGARQAQANMQKAAEELAKSIAKEEASAATGSGAVEDKNEKADARAPHKQQMRDFLIKKLGSMMWLAPCLLHSFNVCVT